MQYHKTVAIEPLGILVDKNNNTNQFAEEAISTLVQNNYKVILWNDNIDVNIPDEIPNIIKMSKNKKAKRAAPLCFFCIDTNYSFAKNFRLYTTVPFYSPDKIIESKIILDIVEKYIKYVNFIETMAT